MQKTICISGSTDGIGRLTALQLARQGHTLILHGRSQDKLDTALRDIKAVTGNKEIYGYLADFADLASVKKLAREIKRDHNKLDILINNAGVYHSEHTTPSGWDIRFVVNFLAPFLLTRELLVLLRASKDPRIINLSSAAQSPVSLDALQGKRKLSAGEAYAQSKLALTMWSLHLAGQESKTCVIAVNPGSLLNTKMVKEAFGTHWSAADKGTDILCELALEDEHKNHSGQYFDNDSGRYAQAHKQAYDVSFGQELMNITQQLID